MNVDVARRFVVGKLLIGLEVVILAHLLGHLLAAWLVRIPAGTFTMGSPPDEKDRNSDEQQHEVEITKAFWMGVCTVTQNEYEKVMASNPSWFSANGGGKNLVSQIFWTGSAPTAHEIATMPITRPRSPNLNERNMNAFLF